MKTAAIMLLAGVMTVQCLAQQPGQSSGFRQRFNQIVQSVGGEAQTNNYQLELTMERGDEKASYRVAFNGGQVSTEFIDNLAKRGEDVEPLIISFSASMTRFEDSGGEALIFIGRNVPVRTKAKTGPEEEPKLVTTYRNIGLNTKIALLPGKTVTIFADEDEKISLTLTEL